MKEWIVSGIGVTGAFICSALGGWDYSIITLLIFLAIDFLIGTLVSLVFKSSTKTSTGGYSSSAGFKGLIKKGCILLVVVVANRLDGQLGTNFIRDAVCIAFITNELVSIIENLGLMGIPLPKVIVDALEVLKAKQESENKLTGIVSKAKEKATEQAETKETEEKSEDNKLKY